MNRPDLRWLMTVAAVVDISATRRANAGEIIQVGQRDLQQVVDSAASNAVVHCDPNRQLTLSAPVVIRKPLTLVGLHAQLPAKLGKVSLLVVEAKGVTVTDFELTGNADSVPQSDRAPLMVIHAGDFRVERGRFLNSSKDGVMIDGDGAANADIVGGVVRDIVGRGVVRDVVSISGSSGHGRKIRNVLVENVRCYDSRLRGALEVSDGITVRKVYAESAVYALDVQDHKQPDQSNRDVVLENAAVKGPAVLLENCDETLLDGFSLRGRVDTLASAVVFRVTAKGTFTGLRIRNVSARGLSDAGIVLEATGKEPGMLTDYLVAGNLTTVDDRIRGERAIVVDNLVKVAP